MIDVEKFIQWAGKIVPLNEKLRQLIRKFLPLFIYLFVGGGAAIVEWIAFYLLMRTLHIHYSWATMLAFCVSTFANWVLGRILLFKKTTRGVILELFAIYAVSSIGLAGNLGIMYVCIDFCRMPDMIAKILATAVVFFGNYLVRKAWIYKEK